MAAEEWSQLPLFELDELARVFPAGERPLPILSGQDAMTSAGLAVLRPARRHLGESSLYLPSVGQGRKSPEVPEGSRETSSEAQPHAVRLRRRS